MPKKIEIGLDFSDGYIYVQPATLRRVADEMDAQIKAGKKPSVKVRTIEYASDIFKLEFMLPGDGEFDEYEDEEDRE